MLKHLLKTVILFVIAISPVAFADTSTDHCEAAYYRFADGSGVDIAPSHESHFRWRKPDGTSGLLTARAGDQWSSSLGWTGRDDGIIVDLSACAEGEIRFAGKSAARVPFDTRDVRFASGDVELAGRLVLPVGRKTVPIVVLVHGSEDSSALANYALQRILPSQGVGVFVYDKRGTGKSTGTFTHDLHQLAADAKRALDKAKSMAGPRLGRIGYYGMSQGGWTAPLAATLGRADFLIVGYGLAVSPFDEDREALALDMTRHGFGDREVIKAQEIGAAAQSIVRDNFQSGYERLNQVVEKYRAEPWFRFVRGNVTGIIVNMPEAQLRAQGPRLLAGIIPDYDPMPVLRKLDTPQLWILGGEDIDAPIAETYRRLIDLKKKGRPISVVVYPHVEHGLYAFEVKGEERLSTRQPASLLGLLIDFARGKYLDAANDEATLNQ